MKILKTVILVFVCFFFLQSCKTDKKTNTTTENPSTTKVENVEPKEDQFSAKGETYFIKNKSFQGVTVGDVIAEKNDILKAAKLSTGEGDFKVFNIHNKTGELLGYVLPDPRDESKVGDIVIVSPKVMTSKGVKVGMTLAELESKIGEVEVHGSEIEGRTSAEKDGLMYRLDANFWQYEIEKSKVPTDAKILEISIRR